MSMNEHWLRGTLSAHDAAEAAAKAHEAASDYFGHRPFVLDLNVDEIRTLGGQVVGYQVDFTANVDALGTSE